jgi:hypothetical protein
MHSLRVPVVKLLRVEEVYPAILRESKVSAAQGGIISRRGTDPDYLPFEPTSSESTTKSILV